MAISGVTSAGVVYRRPLGDPFSASGTPASAATATSRAICWAALAKSCGYPEGHPGNPLWQSFRVARLMGPGYAWPLVGSKTLDVYPAVAAAWRETMAEYDGEHRTALDIVHLVTVTLGTLYARTESEETVDYLRDNVGPQVAERFKARLGHEMFGCHVRGPLPARGGRTVRY